MNLSATDKSILHCLVQSVSNSTCLWARVMRVMGLLLLLSISTVAEAGLLEPSNGHGPPCVPSEVRPQDEIWLVSARRLGCLRTGDVPPLEVERFDPADGWSNADMAELLQPVTLDQIFMLYVHGNRVEARQAAREGRYVYSLIAPEPDDPVSIRYVIWSWPSAQLRGPLRDVRVKAQRTEIGGYCLGWFLSQLPAEQRVSILSYSFGARIATGGLHLLGGGQLSGRSLPSVDPAGHQTRLVMLAAALHTNWLRPGCYHELTLSHTDFLLNLYNSCDPVLKRYRFLYKHSRPEALGFTGMYTGDLGALGERIEQTNAARTVGKTHAAIGYFQNPRFRTRMKQVLSWTPLGPADAPQL
jgi:hypothetical protein